MKAKIEFFVSRRWKPGDCFECPIAYTDKHNRIQCAFELTVAGKDQTECQAEIVMDEGESKT